MSDETLTIPPTEPVQAKKPQPRLKPTAPAPKKTKSSVVADGASLAPDLSQYAAGTERSYAYWVGVAAGCPKPVVHMAGIAFQMKTEIRDPDGDQRIPRDGAITMLTENQINLLAERVPRTIVRFRKGPLPDKADSGSNVTDHSERPKTFTGGTVFTIPTQNDIDLAKAQRRNVPSYRKQPSDRPIAEFIYCIPCEDQANPQRGIGYQTLDKTGLVWPGDEE